MKPRNNAHKTKKCKGRYNTPKSARTAKSIEQDRQNGVKTHINHSRKLPVICLKPIDQKVLKKYIGKYNKNNLQTVNFRDFCNCSVRLINDDLDHLKVSLQLNLEPIVSCRICRTDFTELKALRKHLESLHKIFGKPPKRVSFADQVRIYEVERYSYSGRRRCTSRDYLNDKIKQYTCNYCSTTLEDRAAFKLHIKLHCDCCGVLLLNKMELKQHKTNVCRVLKKYKCNTCKITFFSRFHLREHNFEHSGSIFVCDMCKEQFETKCQVSYHIVNAHSANQYDNLYKSRQINGREFYVCNFCDTSSFDNSIIENHVKPLQILMENKNFLSISNTNNDICRTEVDKSGNKISTNNSGIKIGETLSSSNSLESYKADCVSSDNEKSNSSNRNGILNTKITEFSQYTLNGLQIKKISKPNSGLINDSSSGKDNNLSSLLDKIKSNGLNLQPVQKPKGIVNKIGKLIKPLTIAPRVVSGYQKAIAEMPSPPKPQGALSNGTTEAKLYCQFCNKGFGVSSSLNRHIRTQHSGDDKNRCERCHKNFHDDVTLATHSCTYFETSTVKSTEFSCPVCTKALSSSFCLRRHLEVCHPNVDVYYCKDCKKVFIDAATIQSHQCIDGLTREIPLQATTVNKHSCQYCNKSYLNYHALQEHLNVKHNKGMKCLSCQQIFPSTALLQSHQCLFNENLINPFYYHKGNIGDTEENCDFDYHFVAPIVELTEGDS